MFLLRAICGSGGRVIGITNERLTSLMTALSLTVIPFETPPSDVVAKFKRSRTYHLSGIIPLFPFAPRLESMGLDVERFLEPIDEDLKCGICYSVLEDPLVTSCGHVYCAQCLVQWIAESGSCPLTCEQLAIDDLKNILPLTTLIAKFSIRCENFRRGCPIILKVENIHSHHLKCQYAKGNNSGEQIMERSDGVPESPEFARVVVCEKGCALPLLYQDSSSHNCIKALQTQVASLQMKLAKAEHEKDVTAERMAKKQEALQDRIFSLENELHSYQIQVLNLERQLKDYRSQVGYLQKRPCDQAAEETVDVELERIDGSLGFMIMGGTEVGSCAEGEGIVVSRVAEGGPASKTGGLRVKDRILKVNGVDLSKASHSKAVETIKTATEPIQIVILRRKLKKSIECHVSEVLSTRTQTDLSHDVDTDSGIHDRYSPRQDLQLDGSKFVDDGTSSSECSHRRIDFVRDRLLSLTSESLASSENMTSTETSETSVPRVTLVVKDVNYVNSDVRDENFNESLKGQPFVSAVSDEIYFDPELDYEYEEITLWIGNSDLGLTFSCLEEDESAVYVCDIEQGSVAYLDGRLTLLDQVLKINDVPVTHISDIEPMVCDSSATIKFLVARPAQEVQATLIGCSEGSGRWDDYNTFGIGVIKEEDEDGAETVSSEKTNVDKCEKDSGVGRNDESSEQDVVEESSLTPEEVHKCSSVAQEKKSEVERNNSKNIAVSENTTEKMPTQGKCVKGCENGRTVEQNGRHRRSPGRGGDPPSHAGGSPKRSGDSPKRGVEASSRKSKSRGKSERRKARESSKDIPVEESKGEREQSRHSDQLRSRRLGNVDRSMRASYIRACNKDSIRHINLVGSNGGESEYDNNKSENRKKKPLLGSLVDANSMRDLHQSMEWKVRITKDGSQIFVQKKDPASGKHARNKLLRERAQKITEERKGMTTDDDTHTVYQGRYWPRESRRRQLEKVREVRRKKTHKIQQGQKVSDSGSESGKRNIVEMSHRKMNKRHEHFDDFITLQEILRQRNPAGVVSGPIHVTTV